MFFFSIKYPEREYEHIGRDGIILWTRRWHHSHIANHMSCIHPDPHPNQPTLLLPLHSGTADGGKRRSDQIPTFFMLGRSRWKDYQLSETYFLQFHLMTSPPLLFWVWFYSSCQTQWHKHFTKMVNIQIRCCYPSISHQENRLPLNLAK